MKLPGALAFLFCFSLPAAIVPAPAGAQFSGDGMPALPWSQPRTAADIVRDWIAAVDATPEWQASSQSVTAEGNDGVIVRDLSIKSEGDGALQAEIGLLTLRGHAADGDGFTATGVEVDRARLAAGPVSFTIGGGKLTDVAVPALADIRLDPRRPFTSMVKAYGAVARMRLGGGSIARLQLDQQNGGVASAVSYQNIAFGKLAEGRLAQLSAGPIAMASPAPEGLVRFSVERLDGRGIDIDAFARAFDPDRYEGGAGDGRWRPALAYGAYRNVAIEALGLRATIGSLSVEDFRLRQPARSFAALFDQSVTASLAPREAAQRATEDGLGFLSAMAVGEIRLRDLDVIGTGFSRFRVGAFSIQDASIDGVGEVRVDEVRVAAGGQASFDLGRFAIGRIVLPPTDAIRSAIAAELGGSDSDLSSLMPQVGHIEVRETRLSIPERGEFGIERFELDLGSYVGQFPTVVALDAAGISVDRRFLQRFPEARLLDELGYDRIVLNSRLKLDWQESDSALMLRDFQLSIDKLGKMNAQLDFGGLTRAAIREPGGVALNTLTFGGGAIELTDDSAVDRVFEAQAARLKVEPETLRKRASDFIPALTKMLANPFLRGQFIGVLPAPLAKAVGALTPMLNDPALSEQVVQALQGLIASKGTITVRARPASPVPLGALAEAVGSAPEKLPSLLSVEVTRSP